jgi:hypothetical protein
MKTDCVDQIHNGCRLPSSDVDWNIRSTSVQEKPISTGSQQVSSHSCLTSAVRSGGDRAKGV